MQFIKQNLFLVVLVGATTVAGGIMLAVNFGWAGGVDTEIAKRSRTSKGLAALAKGNLANEEIVDEERNRVDDIRNSTRDIRLLSTGWQKQRFKILEVARKDAQGNILEKVRAFPIDTKLYDDYGLRFEATKEYLVELRKLLAQLKPTRPPTQEEIAIEIDKAIKRLRRKEELEELRRLREMEKAGGVATERRPEERPVVVTGTSASIQDEAKNLGRLAAIANRAKAGMIYATLETMEGTTQPPSFDVTFPYEDGRATYEQLWWGQLNLWIQADIVAAIRETNDAALQIGAGKYKREHVANAAVKRLVGIRINKGCYTGADRKTSGVDEWDREDRGGREGGRFGREDERRRTDRRETRTAVRSKANTLTQRVTCRKYEVIHYEFTVIMPTRHLQALLWNLQQKAYHTVLKHEAVQPTPQEFDTYYYGAEPVMQVTIHGEFLTLSDWTRGRWDKDAKDFPKEYPALMPVSVLMGLERISKSLLRREDLGRVSKQGRRF